MSVSLFRKQGEQFLDSNGRPLSGASMYYYRAATQTPQDTYLDQSGSSTNTNPIVLNTSGRLPTPVYIGSNYDYKEVLLDANGVTVSPWPFDNIPKAAVTAPVATGFERLYMPFTQVTAASSPVTLLTANAGYGYEIDASGGNVDLNLPDATSITAGTGYYFKRMDQTASVVSIVPNGTDMIDGANTAIVIPISYSGAYVVSDGSQWLVVYWIFTYATDAARGLIQIATDAEALAMVNSTHSVVPSNLAAIQPAFEYAEYSTQASISATIPFDGTIPQITEGEEIISKSITLHKTTSLIEATFSGVGENDSGARWAAAVFVDGATDAVKSSFSVSTSSTNQYGGAGNVTISFVHEPATLNPVTFSVRVGASAGLGPININGNYFGETVAASLTLREIFSS